MKIHIYVNFICVWIALFGFAKFSKMKLGIWLLILGSALVDILAFILKNHYHIQSGIVYTLWYPVEAAAFLLMYRTQKGYFFQSNGILVGVLLCLAAAAIGMPDALNDKTQLWPLITAGILLLILSYVGLRNTLKNEGFDLRNPFHWALTANVFYTALMIQSLASVFYFAYVDKNIPLSSRFYILNHAGYVGWSILLTFGILVGRKDGK